MQLYRLFLVGLVTLGLTGIANAKPVDAPPTPDVNVVNTPDVNVVNTPDVNVTNSTLTVQGALTPQSMFYEYGTSNYVTSSTLIEDTLTDDVALVGTILNVQVPSTASDDCFVSMALVPAGGGYFRLASASAQPGNGVVGQYIPLPNLVALAGDTLQISAGPSNGVDCHFEARFHGLVLE